MFLKADESQHRKQFSNLPVKNALMDSGRVCSTQPATNLIKIEIFILLQLFFSCLYQQHNDKKLQCCYLTVKFYF